MKKHALIFITGIVVYLIGCVIVALYQWLTPYIQYTILLVMIIASIYTIGAIIDSFVKIVILRK